MKKRIKKAFTLVELLVVIAILAVLSTVAVVGYNSFTEKAKVSNDQALVNQLNTLLQADEVTDGKAKTPSEALEVVGDNGFDVKKMTPTTDDYNIVWNEESNRFVLLDDKGVAVVEELSDKAYKNWQFSSSYEQIKAGFSVYLNDDFEGTILEINSGLDVGTNTIIKTIKYTNNGNDANAQEVIIRTNFKGTELIVDAPKDTVKHYDEVGSVHIIAVDSTNCYEENGTAAFTQVDSGKYKTSSTADVELLYVSDATDVNIEVVPGTVNQAYAKDDSDKATLNNSANGVTFESQTFGFGNDFAENRDLVTPRVLCVDRVGGQDGFYATFEEAYNAARANDIIHFTAGVFNEALKVWGNPVTIEGEGKDKTFILGPENYTTENIPMQEWTGWSDDKYVYALISVNTDVTIKDLTVEANPEKVGGPNSNPFVDTPSNAFVGIHVQNANAVIENVDIKGMMPNKVNGNSHHGFGLYITSTNDDKYNLTYRNGTVSKTSRGGLYCWANNYTLNFEDVTVIGNGNIDNPNGNLTIDPNESNPAAVYAYCGFYSVAYNNATYKNVEFIDVNNVDGWGGALWHNSTAAPEGVTFTNCH